jgi:hypothetical protein
MNIENKDGTLMDLMRTVQDQSARSADFLANTNNLQFQTTVNDEGRNAPVVIMEAHKGMPTTHLRVNDVAFDQIAGKADIPTRTARRLRDEYPRELDGLVRAIWDKENEPRMVRSFLDPNGTDGLTMGTARAFVSDRFKTFDNVHLLEAALPQLMESDAQWQVVRGKVTDKQMFIELKSEVITADAAARAANPHHNNNVMQLTEHTRELNGTNRTVGDVMALAIRLRNSEVGLGSIQVSQMLMTLACLNGMQTGNTYRSAHLTSARGDAEFARMLKDDTIEADNHALKLKLRDLIGAYADRDQFETLIDKFVVARGELIAVSPQQAVENLGGILKLTKPQTASVLDGLMQTIQQDGYAGHAISKATIINAVTAVQHSVSPDNMNEWQVMGGKVLDLPASQWNVVANKEAA